MRTTKVTSVALVVLPLLLSGPVLAQEKTFTLTVTSPQVQTIGRALAELPYKDVAVLIQQLQAQIAAQDKPTPPPPAPDPESKKED